MSDEKESFSDIISGLQKTFKDIDAEYDKMADECDSKIKLAVTRWVMKHIVEHANYGGSYRYLIYERLGFGPEAYAPLCSDGLTISNEFDLNLKDSVIEAYKSGDEKKLKEALGLCDEPNCFSYISCGWPSDEGYRSTCGEHYDYEGKMKNV
jgi:hypothetical protein